jgi:demethylmenaquinone methyltransferase/2-methoxy-6-polyprenyl-1,4-benzoquinol methylase
VFFIDDNNGAEAEMREGEASSIIERRSNDGTPFRVVKVAFRAEDLERRPQAAGWNIAVTSSGGPFYWGRGGR